MHVRKATLATKYVVADFRDVLGINHVSAFVRNVRCIALTERVQECLKECRRWLAEF